MLAAFQHIHSTRQHGNNQHCRYKKSNPQKLNDRGDIAALLRNRVACPNNLRDIVNSTTQENASLSMGEAEEGRDRADRGPSLAC